MSQLELPIDVRLEPTIAMRRGESLVSQCAWCGLLACWEVASGRRLGACPACGGTEWWAQADEQPWPGSPGHAGHMAGPFHRVPPDGAPSTDSTEGRT